MFTNERGNMIIVFVVIFLLIIVSLFLVFGQKIFLTDKKVEKTPAVSPTTTTSQNLNPNTGDLYQDIKIRMKEVLE